MSSRFWGVVAGALSGACWGIIFLAPKFVADFSPLQLAGVRFAIFGLVSILLIAPRWGRIAPLLTKNHLAALFVLAVLGNSFYYVAVVAGVQWGGIAQTTLIVGAIPVVVTLAGLGADDAPSLRQLMPSILFGLAGVACISFQGLAFSDAPEPILGLFAAFAALVSWAVYAIYNTKCLTRFTQYSTHDWGLLIGLMTGVQGLLLTLFAFQGGVEGHEYDRWLVLVGVALWLAVMSSLMGNYFWNKASCLLPLTLSGAMLLFETLFALLYGFLWEMRFPTSLEAAAILLVCASVISCVTVHRKPKI